ncbi:rhomboid family intramembrane serine protease [Ornithinibacillus halotolerans]|uniref:Rhomboid protease YdcA n=1 Tax=Ornithinibacillus halotolerans TaxID=1274357 RepID=A0A916SDX7_9BACI|nr:rhomboid family intramembrane serine protease [Ornithinibacillus halotolerans]GGA92705.1 putative rhomboid protease YdcA [Ornithinibacillus halotolerans]
MFIRNERSMKEFIRYYPIVSAILVIHLALWIVDILPIGFFERLYDLGVGRHYQIHKGEYWRFITPIFLHGDLMHMLFNSFSLVLFGPALEQMLGKWKFILAYLGAGVLANVATFLINPSFMFSHVGASGAIFGLFGIYVFMVAFRKSLIDAGSARIIMIIFILGLIMTFIRPNINIYGHVLGFIAGFIIAPLVLNKAKRYYPVRYRRSYQDEGDIQFNPNRWKKRGKLSTKLRQNPVAVTIIVIIILAILMSL